MQVYVHEMRICRNWWGSREDVEVEVGAQLAMQGCVLEARGQKGRLGVLRARGECYMQWQEQVATGTHSRSEVEAGVDGSANRRGTGLWEDRTATRPRRASAGRVRLFSTAPTSDRKWR